MAEIRGAIRGLRPAPRRDFDVQLWPILVTLLILAGVSVGVVIGNILVGNLGFEKPLLRNAWTWIVAVAVAGGASLFAAVRYRTQHQRRRHLIVLLAVLAHVGIILAAASIRIVLPTLLDEEISFGDRVQKIVTLSQYFEQQSKRHAPEQVIQTPLKVKSPEAPKIQLDKQETSPEQAKAKEHRVELKDPQEDVHQVKPIKNDERRDTTPRASETRSKMSRQQQPTASWIAKITQLPKLPQETRRAPSDLTAERPVLGRNTRPTSPHSRQTTDAQPVMPIAVDPAIVQRSPTREPPPALAQTPRATLSRPRPAIEDPTRANVHAPQPAVQPTPRSSPSITPTTSGISRSETPGTTPSPARSLASEAPSPTVSPSITRSERTAADRRPALGQSMGGAPLERATRDRVPGTQAEPIDLPQWADAGPVRGAVFLKPTDGLGLGSVSHPTAAVVQVAAQAELGEGGLGIRRAPVPGSLSPRARADADLVVASVSRFRNTKAGADYLPDLRARDTKPEFAGRKRGNRPGIDALRGRPSAKTEAAIERGLVFLAKMQRSDGSWSLSTFKSGYENGGTGSIASDTAATGLALLAFLGAGYDHFDDRYEKVVNAGLGYLLRVQQESGELYLSQTKWQNETPRFYSHAIASIALCEAYGMTTDTKLREPAQRAIDFLLAEQITKGRLGGWRYNRIEDRKHNAELPAETDTSVTGWGLMALKSGDLAGLTVPKKSYGLIKAFLAKAQASPQDASNYVYNPYHPTQRPANPTMTSVALLMRLYTGWNRDHPDMVRGADYLMQNLPTLGTRGTRQDLRKRDTYYWYYATQVMFHMGGEHWKAWNDRLHPMLADTQIQDGTFAGSWSPTMPVPDRWAKEGGRLYVTTMNLLSLEVVYRHLPIYEETQQ